MCFSVYVFIFVENWQFLELYIVYFTLETPGNWCHYLKYLLKLAWTCHFYTLTLCYHGNGAHSNKYMLLGFFCQSTSIKQYSMKKKIRDFAQPSISYIELVLTFRYQINNHEDDWKHVKILKTFIFMHKMVYVIFRVK